MKIGFIRNFFSIFPLIFLSILYVVNSVQAQQCKVGNSAPRMEKNHDIHLISSMAYLSNAIYEIDLENSAIPAGKTWGPWRILDEYRSPSSFHAAWFENQHGDVAVAFEGTNFSDMRDHSAYAAGALSISLQHAEAISIATSLRQRYERQQGRRIIFTGHSLGGGLAQTAALYTGFPAVTFNPVNTSLIVQRFAGQQGLDERILNVYHKRDVAQIANVISGIGLVNSHSVGTFFAVDFESGLLAHSMSDMFQHFRSLAEPCLEKEKSPNKARDDEPFYVTKLMCESITELDFSRATEMYSDIYNQDDVNEIEKNVCRVESCNPEFKKERGVIYGPDACLIGDWQFTSSAGMQTGHAEVIDLIMRFDEQGNMVTRISYLLCWNLCDNYLKCPRTCEGSNHINLEVVGQENACILTTDEDSSFVLVRELYFSNYSRSTSHRGTKAAGGSDIYTIFSEDFLEDNFFPEELNQSQPVPESIPFRCEEEFLELGNSAQAAQLGLNNLHDTPSLLLRRID